MGRLDGQGKKPKNPITGQSAISINPYVVFSFKDLDMTQGQDIYCWAENGLLPTLLQKMHEYSKITMSDVVNGRCGTFKVYGEFPTNTDFSHPPHVDQNARWASMHIKGQPCVAGHVIDSVFYIVFFDMEHHFSISTLKHT